MKIICLHCLVSGRVQGVFYRKNTYDQALLYGVNGWVKNLSDGRVEVMLCGEEKAVYEMKVWLQEGPPRADVTEIKAEELPCEHHTTFEIRG